MRYFFTFLLLIVFHTFCHAQIVAVRQVVGSTGKDTLIGFTNWAWTVGEPVIDTYESSIGIFTQGFHQPDGYSITPGTPYINNLIIYPNPGKPNTTLSFYLRTDRPTMTILIYDAGGRLYQRQVLDSYAGQTWHSLNPQIMGAGTYVVKVQVGIEVYTGRYVVVN